MHMKLSFRASKLFDSICFRHFLLKADLCLIKFSLISSQLYALKIYSIFPKSGTFSFESLGFAYFSIIFLISASLVSCLTLNINSSFICSNYRESSTICVARPHFKISAPTILG